MWLRNNLYIFFIIKTLSGILIFLLISSAQVISNFIQRDILWRMELLRNCSASLVSDEPAQYDSKA